MARSIPLHCIMLWMRGDKTNCPEISSMHRWQCLSGSITLVPLAGAGTSVQRAGSRFVKPTSPDRKEV